MNSSLISDLILGDTITGFFVLASCTLRQYDKGEMLTLELSDSSGRVSGVVWESAAGIYSEIRDADVVKVRGLVSSYRDKLQIKVDKIRPAEKGEYEVADLIPVVPGGIERQRQLFDEISATVEEPFLAELLRLLRGDAELFESFLNAPAGKRFHHDYVGGLAQHSLSMAMLASRIGEHYPGLNRDLLVCGSILHDIGKVEELRGQLRMEYTNQGYLIGHITLGDEIVASLISEIPDFPEKLEYKLRHLIVSHHGERSFGSPVVPQIREAYVLHYIDKIDSGLNVFDRIENKTDGVWSEWVSLWERFLYFG